MQPSTHSKNRHDDVVEVPLSPIFFSASIFPSASLERLDQCAIANTFGQETSALVQRIKLRASPLVRLLVKLTSNCGCRYFLGNRSLHIICNGDDDVFAVDGVECSGDGGCDKLKSRGTFMPLPTCMLRIFVPLPPLLFVSSAGLCGRVTNHTRASAPCERSWRDDAPLSSDGGDGPYHVFDCIDSELVVAMVPRGQWVEEGLLFSEPEVRRGASLGPTTKDLLVDFPNVPLRQIPIPM